jgi:hypothetical protein
LTTTNPYITSPTEEFNNDVFSEYGTFLGKTEYNIWRYFEKLDFAKNYNLGHKRYIINLASVAGVKSREDGHFEYMYDLADTFGIYRDR